MTDADADLTERGCEVQLLGYLDYDRANDSVRRFDVVALGDHWGRDGTPGACSVREYFGPTVASITE